MQWRNGGVMCQYSALICQCQVCNIYVSNVAMAANNGQLAGSGALAGWRVM